MGAYLSEPITEKESSDEASETVAFGASSMQGWRFSQEDAHNCCINFDDNLSLFAVYDGHGGHEVATYCAQNLPQFIKDTEAYENGDIEQALKDAFMGFDATLATPIVVATLKEIAGTTASEGEKKDMDVSDDEENVSNLYMEAEMPLEQVMAKYASDVTNSAAKTLKKEEDGKPGSPLLRARRGREKASCSSSGAGCSSSSWNTNEADVSSSSQPCGSTTSVDANTKLSECAVSSEADQVLDSTTSNGEVAHTPAVVSTVDAEPTKSEAMPDSSEDIKGKVSSGKTVLPEANEIDVGVNGQESLKEGEVADSSKGGGDNVSSSSCTPLENGEAGQQERISSSGRRRIHPPDFYQNLLKAAETSESSDDDDDENDETFDGVQESDEDDTEDVDDDDEDDESDEDEDDEEDDEEDAEPDDDDEFTMKMTEEPGSDSGCTAVVALLSGKELYVANAGDSRCVLCRDGLAFELSLDHKPEDEKEMQRIVNAGGKVTADGRVNGGLNLSRALGDHAYKQNKDMPPQDQMISALPDVRHTTIDPERDEFMVLACDGIWNFMSSQGVVDFVRTRLQQGYQKISQICEELFDHCLAPDTLGDGTGCDNMTAVIVQFKHLPTGVTNTADATANTTLTDTKKRPAPPNTPVEESEAATREVIAVDCKRLKTDAV